MSIGAPNQLYTLLHSTELNKRAEKKRNKNKISENVNNDRSVNTALDRKSS